jgi:hypothetical protein
MFPYPPWKWEFPTPVSVLFWLQPISRTLSFVLHFSTQLKKNNAVFSFAKYLQIIFNFCRIISILIFGGIGTGTRIWDGGGGGRGILKHC